MGPYNTLPNQYYDKLQDSPTVENHQIGATMDQTKELLEMPREFVKDGRQFITRCSKPDKREFLRISQAVGMGFLIMGVIGYVVKLIHIPVNNILVGGA